MRSLRPARWAKAGRGGKQIPTTRLGKRELRSGKVWSVNRKEWQEDLDELLDVASMVLRRLSWLTPELSDKMKDSGIRELDTLGEALAGWLGVFAPNLSFLKNWNR